MSFKKKSTKWCSNGRILNPAFSHIRSVVCKEFTKHCEPHLKTGMIIPTAYWGFH